MSSFYKKQNNTLRSTSVSDSASTYQNVLDNLQSLMQTIRRLFNHKTPALFSQSVSSSEAQSALVHLETIQALIAQKLTTPTFTSKSQNLIG